MGEGVGGNGSGGGGWMATGPPPGMEKAIIEEETISCLGLQLGSNNSKEWAPMLVVSARLPPLTGR